MSIITCIILFISVLVKCWQCLFYKHYGKLIKSTALVATGTDKSLSHPTEFDHDKHTNLFFKKSTHELEFIDYDINSNMEYEYYVSAVNLLNNETFISREKIISTC